jgi:REase_AHJR-like
MSTQTEAEVLQRLLPELEAQGYEVYLHPDRRLLPSFSKNYTPDAVALRKDKNLVIEVARRSADAPKKLERITKLFEGQPKWELRIVWLEPASSQRDLKIQPLAAISKRIAEVQELLDGGSSEGSLLLAWATFEALARAILPEQFQRPQTPGRLVEILANEGYITPSEADVLRVLGEKRNRLIHGELQTHASKAELGAFTKTLGTLLKELA